MCSNSIDRASASPSEAVTRSRPIVLLVPGVRSHCPPAPRGPCSFTYLSLLEFRDRDYAWNRLCDHIDDDSFDRGGNLAVSPASLPPARPSSPDRAQASAPGPKRFLGVGLATARFTDLPRTDLKTALRRLCDALYLFRFSSCYRSFLPLSHDCRLFLSWRLKEYHAQYWLNLPKETCVNLVAAKSRRATIRGIGDAFPAAFCNRL